MRVIGAVFLLAMTVAASAALPPGVQRFPAPDQGFIAAGLDNSVWIASLSGLYHVLPDGTSTLVYPGSFSGIAVTPDGHIWFSTSTGGTIREITPAGVVVNTYFTGTSAAQVLSVATDGAVWCVQTNLAVSRISGGVIQHFPVPANITDIAPAPAGAMWVLGYTSGDVYLVQPDGTTTTINLPTTPQVGWIASSPSTFFYSDFSTPNPGLVRRNVNGSFTTLHSGNFFRGAFSGALFWTGSAGAIDIVSGDTLHTIPIDPPAGAPACIDTWAYAPMAPTPDGHIWVVEQGSSHTFGCPPVNNLLRIDQAVFLNAAGVGASEVPAVSTMGLIAFVVLIAAGAMLKLRA